MASGTIRLLREDEQTLTSLLRMEEASFTVPWSRQTFLSALRHPAYDLIGLFDEDDLIGFCVLCTVFDCSDLQNICVRADRRRNGAGRELLGAALRLCARRGAERVFLEVREHNEAALALYRGAGFEEYGRRKNYYSLPREDAILMVKTLEPGRPAGDGPSSQ